MATNANDLMRKHLITVGDYHRMSDIGILNPQERLELIEGEIVDMSPIGSQHAGTVLYLSRVLNRSLGERVYVSVQSPIVLGDNSEPEPDIAILNPREDYYREAHPGPQDILLVVEVADASLRYDREIKVPLYARYSIPEIWLVDINKKAVTVFNRPNNNQYDNQQTLRSFNALSLMKLPNHSIDLSQLF